MRFAVVGAGAIGGLLGARLALAGEAVTFLARNRNLEAIGRDGFRLIDDEGRTHHAATARAGADAAAIGPVDAVLLTVKAQQVTDVLPALEALVGPETTLVTMINGLPWWYFQRHGGPHEGRSLDSVDPGGTLASAIDPARIVGGIVYPAAELVGPGVVRHIEGHRFTLGEPDGSRSERVVAIAEALMRAGFKAPVTKDIRHEIWVKLWGNLSFNPVSALTHATLEAIVDDAGGRAAIEAMMGEAAAVAAALGVEFRISLAQRIAGARAIGAHKTSMLQDVEAGRALEIEALLGSVVELGRIVGVATPALDLVCGLVRLLQKTLGGAALAPRPTGA